MATLAAASPVLADENKSPAHPLRAGIIGLDTSHVVAFTRIFNDPKATGDVAGVKIAAAAAAWAYRRADSLPILKPWAGRFGKPVEETRIGDMEDQFGNLAVSAVFAHLGDATRAAGP